MNVTCKDRDRISRTAAQPEWAALESHAATCESCAKSFAPGIAQHGKQRKLRDYSGQPDTLREFIKRLLPRSRLQLTQQREALELGALFSRIFQFTWQTANRPVSYRADDSRGMAPEAQTCRCKQGSFAQE